MLQYNPTVTGSLQVSGDITGTVNGINITGLSQSVSTQLISVQVSTGSSDAKFETLSQVTSSVLTRLTNIESKSASVDISLSSINSKTGSYATTGSNSFFGTQTFSGSVYIANDLVVQGSSSIQYISASSVSIGTNIVQLNTANPSVRFAGLTIIDSGSVGGSGSFLYDSVQDEFIFVHRGNGTNVTSSHFVLGPETYDSLGNETYLSCNTLPKGTGKEHLVDSSIFDNGTTVCVNATLKGSGQLCSLMGNFGCIGIGTTSPKTYASLTSCGQIISLNNIGIDVGQSYRLNNYYNTGTATDRTISAGLAASIGLEQSGGAIVFNISSACVVADTTISNVERMRITCTGNVGIGTNCPTHTLVVGQDLGNFGSGYNALVVGCSTKNTGIFIGQLPQNNVHLIWQCNSTVANAYAQLVTYNYSNPIYIDACKVILQAQSAGFVGIGTCTPTSLLEISGIGDVTLTIRTTNSSNPRLKFSGGAGVFNRASSNDTMFFGETTDSGNYNFRGGNVHPGVNGTQDLGTASLRWNTVYTSDLSLSNGIGDYTIVEGEHDLFLYNNKQCKVYKFMLQQVCAECATPKKS